jgi:hypothetical protein
MIPRCELCGDSGQAIAVRVERDGRRSEWAVRCNCGAGGQWAGRLADMPPPLPPEPKQPNHPTGGIS